MDRFFSLCLVGLRQPALYGLVLQVVVTWLVPYGLQRLLFARMDEERRGRGWNDLTWACALLWFAPNAASMIPFAWVTRPRSQRAGARQLLAFGWGVGLGVVTLVLQVLASLLVARLFGLEGSAGEAL